MLSQIQKIELFKKLKAATSVVEVEDIFDSYFSDGNSDGSLDEGIKNKLQNRIDLLLECSNVKYHDYTEVDDIRDRYVNEVTSFLSRSGQLDELYRKYI